MPAFHRNWLLTNDLHAEKELEKLAIIIFCMQSSHEFFVTHGHNNHALQKINAFTQNISIERLAVGTSYTKQ